MFVIKDTIVSLDIIEKYFVCELNVCKGQCCVDGDAGAPLLEEEREEIEKYLDKILPLLTPKGRKVIQEEGIAYYDEEGDLVTQLIEGTNCAYTFFSEDGICLCALEKGYREGLLPNLKPSSCSLYPVRIKKMGDFTALNLHRWKICKCAEKNGKRLEMRAYEFLRGPLERKFGKDWYAELQKTAQEWMQQKERS